VTIFRTEHKKNYTVVNNFITKDKRLSWKAKGIWLYAFSRPDDWSFNLEDLISHSSDGKDSVNAGLKELEAFGYLHRSRFRDSQGKMMKGAEWVFYETPQPSDICEPKTENPTLDNPIQDIPDQANPLLLSTKTIPCTETTQPSIENNNKAAVVVPQKSGGFVKDDIFFAREKLGKDWTDGEIEIAFKAFYPSRDSVIDPLKYIEGIINKKRILKSQKDETCQLTTKTRLKNFECSKKLSETDKLHFSENDTVGLHLASLSSLVQMRQKLGIS
jgi:hypothetical protein